MVFSSSNIALLSFLVAPVLARLPPFWPEENCFNAYSLGYNDIAIPGEPLSSAVNPFSSRFDAYPYPGNKMAGPMLNTTAPCRIKAHVGKPLSFDVYAEDLDAGDVVRIYVLEDPGIPNGARVLADKPYQRCLPTGSGPYAEGDGLGPCPICQASGLATFGFEAVPESPNRVLHEWASNQSRASIRHQERVWCTDSSGPGQAVGVGDGKLEAEAEHGRLQRRQFIWTPLPEQGVCGGRGSFCLYVVKFQAFDASGLPSVIKTVEIEVHKAMPDYSEGSYGLVEGAEMGLKTDPLTGEQSMVGLTELDAMPQWMIHGETYPAYVYCPMEFALGVHGGEYKTVMEHTTPNPPPMSQVEWRAWDRACHDMQPEDSPSMWDQDTYLGGGWTDKDGRSCADYARLGLCDGGRVTGGYDARAQARPGGVAAQDACCVCGGGAKTACAGRSNVGTCELATAGAGVAFGRTLGCGWDGSRCLGQSYGYAVMAGPYESEWRVEPAPPVADRVVAIFRWTPERGMEGSRHTVCFQASDQYQMNPLEEVCVVLHVQKCRYCARVGETLKYIAEHYNHDTNWLRLWNYNPDITDPDTILRSFLPVTIGSTYKVQPGDSLSRIAARLRTTVKKILEVNPDMASTDIDVDQELCIMPCTLNPIVGAGTYGYVPEAINGIPPGFQERIPRFSHDPPFQQPR